MADDPDIWDLLVGMALCDIPLMDYGEFHAETMRLLRRPRTEATIVDETSAEPNLTGWTAKVQSPSEIERLVGLFGEEHRELIRQAIAFLDANEPIWGVCLDRVGYIRECLAHARSSTRPPAG